jgi:hypothetical protein
MPPPTAVGSTFPSAPPPPTLDPGRFSATDWAELERVQQALDQTARDVHATLLRSWLAYCRLFGAFLLLLSISTALSDYYHPVFSSFAPFGSLSVVTWAWLLLVGSLGLFVLIFPNRIRELRERRRLLRLSGADPAASPSIERSSRTIGEMRKGVNTLDAYRTLTLLFLVVLAISIPLDIANILDDVRPSDSIGVRLALVGISYVSVGVPISILTYLWARQTGPRIRTLEQAATEAEWRFRSLEQAFWQRY